MAKIDEEKWEVLHLYFKCKIECAKLTVILILSSSKVNVYKAPNNAMLHVSVIALSFVQIPEQRGERKYGRVHSTADITWNSREKALFI